MISATEIAIAIVDQMSTEDRKTFTVEGWRDGISAMLAGAWNTAHLDDVLAAVEEVVYNRSRPTLKNIVPTTTVQDKNGIDAVVVVDGVEIGEVTLLRDQDGELAIWGEQDMWASDGVCRWLNSDLELIRERALAIEAAARGL